ncbi:MAG: hypothetical protein MZW92_45050 [Comamonadaceae bacterium]|nr:hypothetical protein [Comamonadaceae bacterium]
MRPLAAYDRLRGATRAAHRRGRRRRRSTAPRKPSSPSILTKAGSEDDRQKALSMARSFAQRLPLALEELPRDCGCLVVLKSAVAGPTPRTRRPDGRSCAARWRRHEQRSATTRASRCGTYAGSRART